MLTINNDKIGLAYEKMLTLNVNPKMLTLNVNHKQYI